MSIDWLEAFVRNEARDVAETALHEMTDLYIIESQFITFFRRKLLKDRIRGALKEAVDEMLCEHFVNKAIAKILEDITEPLALLGAEEEFYEREAEEIEKGFDDLILRNIMEVARPPNARRSSRTLPSGSGTRTMSTLLIRPPNTTSSRTSPKSLSTK